jgi:phosphoglycolate phosphatase-like HAD superfamily hydrolase
MKPSALIFDFDQTLAPETMHNPMLRSWGLDPAAFWASCNALQQGGDGFDLELSYLYRLVEEGRKDPKRRLDAKKLQDWGTQVQLYPGLVNGPWGEGLFEELKRRAPQGWEAYIISGGMEPMIQGCLKSHGLSGFFKSIFACRMAEEDPGDGQGLRLSFPKEVVGYTAKTQKLFAISKGAWGQGQHPHVNDYLDPSQYQIPFKQMLYLGDGMSDIAAFALIKRYGGAPLAVYHPGDQASLEKARKLQFEGRAQQAFEADYTPESPLRQAIVRWVLETQGQGTLF